MHLNCTAKVCYRQHEGGEHAAIHSPHEGRSAGPLPVVLLLPAVLFTKHLILSQDKSGLLKSILLLRYKRFTVAKVEIGHAHTEGITGQ